jgi:hypothetical protein
VGEEPERGGAEEGVQLVLDEGAEALADEHLGEVGVSGLLEALEEQLLDEVGGEDLGVEVALLDAGGVDKDDAVHSEGGDSGEHLLERLGAGDGEQQVHAGAGGRGFGEGGAEVEDAWGVLQHLAGAHEASEPAHAEGLSGLGAQDFAGVLGTASREAGGAVGEEVLVEEQEQVHGRTPCLGSGGAASYTPHS